MLKKLKNSQILDLIEGITIVNQMTIESTKQFSYAMILNDSEHRTTAEAILKLSAPAESYAKYEEARDNLIKEYAIKDADGNPALREGKWVTIEEDRKAEFDAKLESLNDENSEVVDKRNKDVKDFADIVNTVVDAEIHIVSLDEVPDEVGRNIQLMRRLIPMIG